VDVLWIDRSAGLPSPLPLAHAGVRWHALPPLARALDGPATAALSMRVHWWLATWALRRPAASPAAAPLAVHFAPDAASLAHYPILSKRSGERYARLVLAVHVADAASARAPVVAEALAPLERMADACMRAQALRHADVCIAADEAAAAGAASTCACARTPAVLPLIGTDAVGAGGDGMTSLWTAFHQPAALAGALERADAAAAAERERGWRAHAARDAAHAAAAARALEPARIVLSICIVSHDRGALLEQALESIHAQLAVGAAVRELRVALRPGERGGGGGGARGGGGGRDVEASIEVLVVDDGSSEPYTLRVLDALESAPPPGPAAGTLRWPIRVHRLPTNGYLGAARNVAAQLARGDWLLFMDDDNVAKPQMLFGFARAAARSGAAILTCVNHKWPSRERPPQPNLQALPRPSPDRPPHTPDLRPWLLRALTQPEATMTTMATVTTTVAALHEAAAAAAAAEALASGDGESEEWARALAAGEGEVDGWAAGEAPVSDEATHGAHWLPLGACLPLGAHANCFGDAHVLLRSSAARAVGGYTIDYGLGLEDWELYARLALRGTTAEGAPLDHLVIPSPLYWYRLSRGGGMLARANAGSAEARAQQYADRLRALRPYVQTAALAGDDGAEPWPHAHPRRTEPSLEALVLYGEHLRSAAAAAPCVGARAIGWVGGLGIAAVGLVGALVLRRLLRRRRLLARYSAMPRDRSA
jgi:hypothetical protein